MVFLDPTTDIAFKKLFGNSEHKNILISFLNSVLERVEGEKIVDVIINNPYNLPETLGAKASIVDVRCVDQEGINYLVEMQVTKQEDYLARCQYYSAIALARQLQNREQYEKLVPVIFIAVLDFNLLTSPHYLSHHLILNKATYEHSLKHLEFHFIELEKFSKELDRLDNTLDKWIYFLKNAPSFEAVPKTLGQNKEVQDAFTILAQHNWSTQELEAYEVYIDAIRSHESQMKTAMKDAFKDGKLEVTIEIARKLLASGMKIENVAQMTGLSIDDIKKLTS